MSRGSILVLAFESGQQFEGGLGDISDPDGFECVVADGADAAEEVILGEQFKICSQQIKDRCVELGFPVVNLPCPCWKEEDLNVVTADNVIELSCADLGLLDSLSNGVDFFLNEFEISDVVPFRLSAA